MTLFSIADTQGSFAPSNGFARKPWIGPRYRSSAANLLGSHLLIVGESHHHKCDSNCIDKSHEELTTRTVQAIVSGGLRHPFFTKIANLFRCGDDVAGFWNSVSFYNYLQQLFEAPRASVNPRIRLDLANQMLFFRILREVEPNRVLVLGKSNWSAIPSRLVKDGPIACRESPLPLELPGRSHDDDKHAYWYPVGNHGWTLVGAIQHPSSYGFSASELHSWVESFMAFPAAP